MKEYDKLVFLNKSAQKEWDELDPKIKNIVTVRLNESIKMMSQDVAINVLALYLMQLAERIEKLEVNNG